ncbi:MAG: hypothetical protein WC184_03100 [Acidimicrobiia bacterium]
MITTFVFVRSYLSCFAATRIEALNSDRGEGVISAAIAVLIMAFLGAAMWVGFNSIWGSTEANIGNQVDQIGR